MWSLCVGVDWLVQEWVVRVPEHMKAVPLCMESQVVEANQTMFLSECAAVCCWDFLSRSC